MCGGVRSCHNLPLGSVHEHEILPAEGPCRSRPAGFSLAIPHDGDYRLFQVDCTQMCQRSGQPVMIRLMSESVDGGQPWVLEYEAGTAVIRLLGVCQAAS